MAIFNVWDTIKVPFPYIDRPVRQRRPALVVATNGFQDTDELLWVLMITSAENRGWHGDVEVTDLATAGLPVASVIRTAKIATIQAKEAERMGELPVADQRRVTAHLQELLAPALNCLPRLT